MGVKATFVLDEALMNAGRELVKMKRFRSMNALVEQALRDELAQLRREEIKAALHAASQDDQFLRDIADIEEDFAAADQERIIDP